MTDIIQPQLITTCDRNMHNIIHVLICVILLVVKHKTTNNNMKIHVTANAIT